MRDEKISQHYVPQLHLRKFSTTQDSETLYCLDKQNKRSFQTSTSKTATEDFFYDGKTKLVPDMENFLENLEAKASEPYRKIVETESLDKISPKEKTTLALFLAVQLIRTRGERSSVQGMVEGIEEKVGRENMAEELRNEIDEMRQEESLRELQNDLIKDGGAGIANILTSLEWHLILNNTDLPYYTSDHPVVRHNELDFGPYGNLGLANRGIQVFFPLTPWMKLLLIEPSVYPDMPEVSETTDRETVVFQRDLQVQRSNRFVYSSDDDFEQAEKRIDETPEIAEPLSERVSVE